MENILLIGGGGREHAIAAKISKSPHCDQLFVCPGNAGTSQIATNINIAISDFSGLESFCLSNDIHLIIVGPEQPLVDGIYDYFKESKIKVLGPSQKAARLEGSKSFANSFMAKYEIPTASSKDFTLKNIDEGLAYIDNHALPIVLKADGLAAGKGVLIVSDREEAKTAFKEMLSGKFGEASSKVVIEQFLDGIEFSVFVLTDGDQYIILPEAKDYKRIGEGDQGLNTGGMGSISPVPFYDEQLQEKVKTKIIEKTISGIKKEGLDYKGFIFIGLIKVDDEPYVIEYNCRMGDPETESVFPRIQSDIVDLFNAVFNGTLHEKSINIDPRTASTVFLVSGGYPEKYEKGKTINLVDPMEETYLFHAGTTLDKQNNVVTSGGRVLACTALAKNKREALQKSYMLAEKIEFEGKFYRKDIGFDL